MGPEAGLSPIDLGLEDKETAEKEKPIDALVVFGFGITSDQDLEKAAMGKSLIGHPERGWRLPLGAKLRTMAAAKLFSEGQVGDVILTGGAVKEKEGVPSSEAQLMKDYFLKKLEQKWRKGLLEEYKEAEGNIRDAEGKIRPDIETKINEIINTRLQDADQHILLEDKATNTIENFAHTINYLEENKEQYRNISLLSNDFHLDRIVKLANKLGVKGEGQGAEELVSEIDPRLEKVADNYFDPEQNQVYREEVLKDLDDEERQVVEARLGTSIVDYQKGERRWSRGLDEIPEYWLPNVKFIKNPDQLKRILKAEQSVQEVLAQKGITDIDGASEEEIRAALDKIERKMPPKEWEEEIYQ